MIDIFIHMLRDYSLQAAHVESVLIVGSYAKGAATESSDIDVVFITSDKARMIADPGFTNKFGEVLKQQTEYYGACTSIRTWYRDGKEVEFGIVEPSWISLPLDSGTYRVLSGGFKIIADKKQHFKKLEFVKFMCAGKDMIFNDSARELFDTSVTDSIAPVNEYPICRKQDPWGRVYYGITHLGNTGNEITESADLSWFEWDRNEIHIDGTNRNDIMSVFAKAVAIAKSWVIQMEQEYSTERFVIFAAFDDGSELDEDSEPQYGFTMRFWKIRDGQGMNENISSDQPLIKWISK